MAGCARDSVLGLRNSFHRFLDERHQKDSKQVDFKIGSCYVLVSSSGMSPRLSSTC